MTDAERLGLPATLKLFSIIVPVMDEQASLPATLRHIHDAFSCAGVPHEIIVVEQANRSGDYPSCKWGGANRTGHQDGGTGHYEQIKFVKQTTDRGFAGAYRIGLLHANGDAITIMCGDDTDDPAVAVRYWQILNDGYDCAFSSRFMRGGEVERYPLFKLLLNRIFNPLIQVAFWFGYNDATYSFKAYKRTTLEGLLPIIAKRFNISIELSLKAISRGYSFKVIPAKWKERNAGESKFYLLQLSGDYLFSVGCVLLEKWLTHGDYRKQKIGEYPLTTLK